MILLKKMKVVFDFPFLRNHERFLTHPKAASVVYIITKSEPAMLYV